MTTMNPPPPQAPPTTTSIPLPEAHTLLTSFSAFLTISIHNILYYRGLYPRETFLSVRAYNLPVHQSRHPKVCDWIRDAVVAVDAQLARGTVERVAVAIHAPSAVTVEPPKPPKPAGWAVPPPKGAKPADPAKGKTASGGIKGAMAPPSAIPPNAVLERWLFDVRRFPSWPGGAEAMRDFESVDQPGSADGEADEPTDDFGGDGDEDEDGDGDGGGVINWADVDEQFRGAVRRMAAAGEALGPLPAGSTFTVAVELKEEASPPIGHPQPWIPSPGNLQLASKSRPRPGRDIGGATVTPIRSVEAGPLFFECWLEEGKTKELLKKNIGKTATVQQPKGVIAS